MVNPAFRFAARHVFLTYPRCDGTVEDYLAWIKERHPVQFYTICSEAHADQPEDANEEGVGAARHIHAVITFERKINSRLPNLFDWLGHHPNIQAPRNLKAAINYVKKGGVFIDNRAAEKRTYGDILAQSTNADEIIEAVKTHHPRDYLLFRGRIRENAEHLFPKEDPQYEHPADLRFVEPLPGMMADWVDNQVSFNQLYFHHQL